MDKPNSMFDYFVEKILDGKSLKNGLLNQKRLIKIIDMHKNRDVDRSMMIYTLGMFEIWLSRYESDLETFHSHKIFITKWLSFHL